MAAARTQKLGKQALAGLECVEVPLLEHEGRDDLAALWADSRFRFRTGVTVANTRVFRTRPRFTEWSADVKVDFLATLLDPKRVVDIFQIGGFRIGIGDYRPRYGRFTVERLT